VSLSIQTDDGFVLRPEELAELRRTFFDQGREAVELLGREVLALEGQAPTAERLSSPRRAAHTLKGDCASVGFGPLSTLAHALEDAFVAMESSRRTVSSAQADRLLEAVDALRDGLEAGAKGRSGPRVEPVVERLRLMCTSDGAGMSWLAGLATVERQRVEEARMAGATTFHVGVSFTRSCRDRHAVARRVADALGTDLVTVVPLVGLVSEVDHFDVLVVTRSAGDEVLARLKPIRGARYAIEECEVPAAPAAPETSSTDAGHDGETVRIEAGRIDEVLTLVGELVTVRSVLAGLATDIEPFLPGDLGQRLLDAQSLLGRALQDLQRSTMRMRMVPADRVFRRFLRVVRDLGRQTGKPIRLSVEGESTELDRGILEALEDPLLHLVRNAVAHGIEEAPERAIKGKPAEARLTLRAGREGNQILIEIADDGRGIDADVVRARAVERGFISVEEAVAMSDADARQLIFRPGLSTAAVLTEHAGRGVGLDVVRSTVEALRGSVTAENGPDGGALFLIRVPLTIAIIQALLFRVAGRPLAFPMSSVVEIARLEDVSRQWAGAAEIFRLRDEVLGLVRLSRLLGLPDGPARGYVMILQCGAGRFGVLADEMCGEQELVIKRVHDRWIRTPLVAGASIVGGGLPTLILDVLAVYRAAMSSGSVNQ
jgi:two-component system, chemotaxis family, sensor kinase CheA